MKKISFYLVNLILIISFSKGVLELIGIPPNISQLTIDVLILTFFIISFIFILRKGGVVFAVGLVHVFLFIVFIIISYLLNETNYIELLLFVRALLIYYLFFYALLNTPFTKEEKDVFVKVLIILFLVQIPAAFIKLILLGGTLEKIVGTVSIGEGSLATVMPLVAIAFLISKYLVYKNIKYIILVLFFISIGLISNKLGILFYVVFLFIFITYLYSSKKSSGGINFIFFKKMTLTSIYISVIVALFISLNPRANPEHKIGGSIDLDYLITYTQHYNTLKLKGSRVEADGRSDAPFVAFNKLSNGGLLNILVGYGPGDIIKSMFSKYKDPLLAKYNIGYGGRLGLVWVMMQVGLVGVFIFLLFHLYVFYRAYYFYKYIDSNNKEELYLSIFFLSIVIIYFLDFFTYSSKMIHSPSVAITYFFSIYYLFSYEKEKMK